MRCLLVAALALVVAACATASQNGRPIIGILTLPNHEPFPGTSYFPASYVKWVESGGSRVVPIPYTLPEPKLRALIKNLNGFLYTGGGVEFTYPNGTLTEFTRSAQIIYEEVVSAAEQGEHVPLWGTCLGFQLLTFLASGPSYPSVIVNGFDSENLTLPLTPTSATKDSRLFTSARADGGLDQVLLHDPVTMNYHQAGVTPTLFSQNGNLTRIFGTPLSTNKDRQGREFVSTIEGKTLPLYGVQWHPEKVMYEWGGEQGMDREYNSVRANAWTARFFVEEARKNFRHFASEDEETKALIYNYNPIYTVQKVPHFEQCYFFD